jgi:hypothetical protein
LNKIENRDAFVSFIDQLLWGKPFALALEKEDGRWTDHWESYLIELKKANHEMIQIVEKCIDESRILWVIGY